MAELGELSNPAEDDKKNIEVPSEPERRSVFRWLRDRGLLIYMTAALSAATPFKHERMEAAEISRLSHQNN